MVQSALSAFSCICKVAKMLVFFAAGFGGAVYLWHVVFRQILQ